MKGRAVEVDWNGKRYAATICEVHPDGTYDVAYNKHEYEKKVTAGRISFSVNSEKRVVTARPSSCCEVEEQEPEPVLYVSDYRVHPTRRKGEGVGVDADFGLSHRPAKDGVVYQKVTLIYSIDGITDEVKHITEAWIVRGKAWKGKGKRTMIEQGGTDSFLVPYQGVMSGAGWLEIRAVAWYETGKVDGEMARGTSCDEGVGGAARQGRAPHGTGRRCDDREEGEGGVEPSGGGDMDSERGQGPARAAEGRDVPGGRDRRSRPAPSTNAQACRRQQQRPPREQEATPGTTSTRQHHVGRLPATDTPGNRTRSAGAVPEQRPANTRQRQSAADHR